MKPPGNAQPGGGFLRRMGTIPPLSNSMIVSTVGAGFRGVAISSQATTGLESWQIAEHALRPLLHLQRSGIVLSMKPLRIGLIGAGKHGSRYAKHIVDDLPQAALA